MSTFKKTFPTFVIFLTIFISCKDSKTSQDQITETPKDTAIVQTEMGTVATDAALVLSDTIGLYKLNNAEAKAYILEMNWILSDIDKTIDENAPNKMPALMGKQRELLQKQNTVQSALTEEDRALFKIYANKIADRLLAMATRLENMK